MWNIVEEIKVCVNFLKLISIIIIEHLFCARHYVKDSPVNKTYFAIVEHNDGGDGAYGSIH